MISHDKARTAIQESDLIGRRDMKNGPYIIINDYIAQRERLELAIKRVLNLTKHPYFPEIKDLPAWQEALAELEEVR